MRSEIDESIEEGVKIGEVSAYRISIIQIVDLLAKLDGSVGAAIWLESLAYTYRAAAKRE